MNSVADSAGETRTASIDPPKTSGVSARYRDDRPWGHFEIIDQGARHQVKRLVVSPGARLSLQSHHHRAEHWVVVAGVAEVTCGSATLCLHEDQSVHIPCGAVHRLANPGKIPLEVIEVQIGSYLGEDDIERLEDDYKRAGADGS